MGAETHSQGANPKYILQAQDRPEQEHEELWHLREMWGLHPRATGSEKLLVGVRRGSSTYSWATKGISRGFVSPAVKWVRTVVPA